ncbi:Hcp family type VI secretion system effector [Inquilinus sp. CA228]|uniref:Hcp family type VI secretion system effector n=1 Tax=Inquilinus sp. CA228 TaxID=3455609 RepID=UPI003F8D2E2C
MPTPAYLTITGQSQGPISKGANTADSVGNAYQQNHPDECLVQMFENHVAIPRDPQSGQPTGLRVHEPASFTKAYDKASPLLWQALANGETLELKMAFFRTSLAGQQEKYFEISWTDALLVEGKGFVYDCLDPDTKNYPHMETWCFSYRAVQWEHVKCGTVGSDDWRQLNTSGASRA